MRLPQDRILHIDTEFKDGKVNIVAEWQGEIVRCKDCKYWVGNGLLWDGKKGKIPPLAMCWDNERTDDYCSFGERRTDGKETTNT